MQTAVHYIPEDLNVDRCIFANFEYSSFVVRLTEMLNKM